MAGERERQVMAQEASWVIWGRALTGETDNFRPGIKGEVLRWLMAKWFIMLLLINNQWNGYIRVL